MSWENDLAMRSDRTRAAQEDFQFLLGAGETPENAAKRSGFPLATYRGWTAKARKERK